MPSESGVISLTVWLDREAPEPRAVMENWGDSDLGDKLDQRKLQPLYLPENRVAILLGLARDVLSGMLYGYEFVYVPSDRARNISEVFTLTPVFMIPWGDPGLEFIQSHEDDQRMEARFRYFLEDWQIQRRTAWLGSEIPNSQGIGTADYTLDASGQQLAIQDAMKQAIREYARGITYDKPQRISGQVLLETPPRVIVQSGRFTAQVRVRIQIDVLKEYRVF